jgi:hypothetical protein
VTVAQLLRNVSVQIPFGPLQTYLAALNPLIDEHIPKMQDFLLKLGVRVRRVVDNILLGSNYNT